MDTFIILSIVLIFCYWFFKEDKPKVYLKYYLFDWDDNLLYMPTQVYLVDRYGKEFSLPTSEYAKIRKNMSEFGYRYLPDSFRDFRSGVIPFLVDVQNAKLGPSWNDFVEAINTGAFFGIITARGHDPKVFKETIKVFVNNGYKGISKHKLMESLKKRKEKANETFTNYQDELDSYLDNCLFYPVAYYNENGSSSPEQLKKEQIQGFIQRMKNEVKRLNKEMRKRGDYKYKLVPKFGFSDDDLNNIDHSLSIKDLFVYSTHNGDKNRIK